MLTINLKNRPFFIVILLLHVTLYAAILSNIPVFRSVVGFVYLLFVPGIVLLRLFKLKNIDITEKAVFSVGLSVAFLMILGLFLDLIAPLGGLSNPRQLT